MGLERVYDVDASRDVIFSHDTLPAWVCMYHLSLYTLPLREACKTEVHNKLKPLAWFFVCMCLMCCCVYTLRLHEPLKTDRAQQVETPRELFGYVRVFCLYTVHYLFMSFAKMILHSKLQNIVLTL